MGLNIYWSPRVNIYLYVNWALGKISRTAKLQIITKFNLLDIVTERKNKNHFQLSLDLSHPVTRGNTYWTVLKTIYNGKKVPLIPLLVVNNQLITDLWGKASFWKLDFGEQCKPVKNGSPILPKTYRLCDTKNLSIYFEDQDILRFIQK